MELAGWILAPGKWLHSRLEAFWEHYFYLVGVREENEALYKELNRLRLLLAFSREREKEAERLEKLLGFKPPPEWDRKGARVIGHKLGPGAVLETVLIDVGKHDSVQLDWPVITPDGVVGRIFKPGLNFSSVLLLTDPNSRIPVISSESRVPAIAIGQGEAKPLSIAYVPQNAPLKQGDIFVTSGLAGIFPRGLPVARVTSVLRSDVSLFQVVEAEPMVQAKSLEEVFLLFPRVSGQASEPARKSNP
jgi:rod shape-determining protein MreC